jgi:hypothetical protein
MLYICKELALIGNPGGVSKAIAWL